MVVGCVCGGGVVGWGGVVVPTCSQQEIRNLRAELQSVRQAEAALQAKLATISRSVTLVTRPHGAHQHESTVGS